MRGIMLLAAVLAMACGPAPSRLLVTDGVLPIDELLERHPLANDAALRADEVARTAAATVHLVQVRGRESPHRHDRHDLVVTVMRGDGVLVVGDVARRMGPGDTAVVPRGTPHWFDNRGGPPAVALVVFAPALDAPDVAPVVVDSPRGAR